MIHRTQRTILATALTVAFLSLSACSSSSDTPSTSDSDVANDLPNNGANAGSDAAVGTDGVNDATTSDENDVGAGIVDGDLLPADVARRLESALSLYRGGPIELATALVEQFDAPGSGVDVFSREPAAPAFANATGETVQYTCFNGGSATSRDTTDESGLLRQRDVEFTECRVGAYDVSGSARRGANPVPDGIVLPAPFVDGELEPFYSNIDLRFTDARTGSTILLDGNAQAFTNFSERTDQVALLTRNWATGSNAARLVDSDGELLLASIAVGISYSDNGTGQIVAVSQSGDLELSGDNADGVRTITTQESFERDATEDRYTTGVMVIRGDGFSYTLDASNGDPASFQLTVDADSSTTSYTVPWSEQFNLSAFLPGRVDLGFGS